MYNVPKKASIDLPIKENNSSFIKSLFLWLLAGVSIQLYPAVSYDHCRCFYPQHLESYLFYKQTVK